VWLECVAVFLACMSFFLHGLEGVVEDAMCFWIMGVSVRYGVHMALA
jgi:hypothetical protein